MNVRILKTVISIFHYSTFYSIGKRLNALKAQAKIKGQLEYEQTM